MVRWKLHIALLLACWLPLQSALAWLPVAASSTIASPIVQMSNMESGCHGMSGDEMAAMPEPAFVAKAAPCQQLLQLLGLDPGSKHCSACFQVPPGLPGVVSVPDFGPRPAMAAPEFVALNYNDFIPGIPSPPPCLFLS